MTSIIRNCGIYIILYIRAYGSMCFSGSRFIIPRFASTLVYAIVTTAAPDLVCIVIDLPLMASLIISSWTLPNSA